MTLKGRNLLKMMDFTPEEILYLVDLSAELKEKKHQGIMHDSLIGKNIDHQQDRNHGNILKQQDTQRLSPVDRMHRSGIVQNLQNNRR